MTTAELPQHMQALRRASEVRSEAARQRKALVGAPPSVLVPALVHPTKELGTYTLKTLFASSGTQTCKHLIKGVGKVRLARVLHQLERDFPNRRHWRAELKLGQLTVPERRRLIKALLRVSSPLSEWGQG